MTSKRTLRLLTDRLTELSPSEMTGMAGGDVTNTGTLCTDRYLDLSVRCPTIPDVNRCPTLFCE